MTQFGSTDSDRTSDELSPKEKFGLLLQALECYVVDAQHQVNQQLNKLRKRYPNYDF
jgi:hypothetical protein